MGKESATTLGTHAYDRARDVADPPIQFATPVANLLGAHAAEMLLL
jgi:hypothetical protein